MSSASRLSKIGDFRPTSAIGVFESKKIVKRPRELLFANGEIANFTDGYYDAEGPEFKKEWSKRLLYIIREFYGFVARGKEKQSACVSPERRETRTWFVGPVSMVYTHCMCCVYTV